MLRLRFLRCSRGLRQYQVQAATRVLRNDLRLIETGRLVPTAKQLKALGEFFGIVPPERLLEHIVDPLNSELPLAVDVED